MISSNILLVLFISSPLFWTTYGTKNKSPLKCYVCDDLAENNTCTKGNRSQPQARLQQLQTCHKNDVACYNGRFMKHGTGVRNIPPQIYDQKKCVAQVDNGDVYQDGERPDIGICIHDDLIFRPKEPAGGARSKYDDGFSAAEVKQNYTIVDMDYICLCNDKNGCNSGRRLVSLSPRFVSGAVAIAAMIVVSKILCTI